MSHGAITQIPSNLSQRSDLAQLFLSETPLLDVRAPVEFAQGAFPGARNYPLMNDLERHRIGIEYKEAGQQSAIELGHTLVSDAIKASRVQAWVAFARQHPDGVLYCFRGGLRSQIAQTWLHEAGIDYPRVSGGYKAMRQFLLQQLTSCCEQSEFIVLGGLTGCGKTDIIRSLKPVIDLEGLAAHRGSSFGGRPEKQPSQIDFENALAIALLKLSHQNIRRIAIEDEAQLIGRCAVPDVLRAKTAQSALVWVTGRLEDRVQRLQRDYIDKLASDYMLAFGSQHGFEPFSAHLTRSLFNLRKRLGMQRYTELNTRLQQALQVQEQTGSTTQHSQWIEPLMVEYYDPMYQHQRQRNNQATLFEGSLDEVQLFLTEILHA